MWVGGIMKYPVCQVFHTGLTGGVVEYMTCFSFFRRLE